MEWGMTTYIQSTFGPCQPNAINNKISHMLINAISHEFGIMLQIQQYS